MHEHIRAKSQNSFFLHVTFACNFPLPTHNSKNIKLQRFYLSPFWEENHAAVFQSVKDAITHGVTIAHLDEGKKLCLYTDPSDSHYAAVLAQIPPEDVTIPRNNQRHEPLSFVGGSFRGSLENWSTYEKEAYAVLESMERISYFTLSGEVFIYTDHLNLVNDLEPQTQSPHLAKHVLSKVQLWGIRLSAFEYSCVHVPGEDNAWDDLLTRWGSPPRALVSFDLFNAHLRIRKSIRIYNFSWQRSSKHSSPF